MHDRATTSLPSNTDGPIFFQRGQGAISGLAIGNPGIFKNTSRDPKCCRAPHIRVRHQHKQKPITWELYVVPHPGQEDGPLKKQLSSSRLSAPDNCGLHLFGRDLTVGHLGRDMQSCRWSVSQPCLSCSLQ